MPNVVIVGSQWGDEGKGKIVDLLTENSDIVVRFQGGPNAGHTVVVGDKTTILHQIPSGILRQGKKCIIGNGVVIDIETLMDEIATVKSQGYFTDDSNLLISQKAHVIMPYHKKIDIAREKSRGQNKIGTTGRGIGPAYEDKAGRHGIRIADIFDDAAFRDKLNTILDEKNFYLREYLKEDGFSAEEIFEKFLVCRDSIKKYVGNAAAFLNESATTDKKILFEGAQGSMLDIDHGTYPFVTSSNTVSAQAATGSGIGPKHLDVIAGISKAYTTRVGSGPFPTEQDNETGKQLRDRGGEYGATTGRPRRCGWFDFVTVKHAIMVNSITHLIITKLDVLSGFDTIKVCTGYKYRGEDIRYFPADFTAVMACEPVYEELDGWKEDIGSVTNFKDLPASAKKYIEYIEKLSGIPVIMVSVGYRRDQVITITNPFSL